MRKWISALGFTMITFAGLWAQLPTDSVMVVRKNGSTKYYYGDEKLTMPRLVNIVGTNVKAYPDIKRAQNTRTLTNLCAFTGGFVIGYQVADIFFGKDPNLILSGVAVVLIGISFPLDKKADEQTIRAIDTYHQGLKTSSVESITRLNVVISRNGVGVAWTL